MSLIPEIDGATIAILGSFNPAILHPTWLELHNLIRGKEADNAKIEIISPEFSGFSLDWFQLQVLRDRFMVRTADSSHFEPIRDLVLGIFSILEHTPISALGLNRNMHFKMISEEKWHEFGHLIAPKKIWTGIMKQPGVRSLTMEDPRSDPPGFIGVKIEPSRRIRQGVYIEVNNHYKIEENNLQNMLRILKEMWTGNINSAIMIAEHLLTQKY